MKKFDKGAGYDGYLFTATYVDEFKYLSAKKCLFSFLSLLSLREVFSLLCLRFCFSFWYKMASSVIKKLQGSWEGIGKSALVETVHICSSRRRDKCSAYCLL